MIFNCPCGFCERDPKDYMQHVHYHFQWSRGLKLPKAVVKRRQWKLDRPGNYAANVTELSDDLTLWRVTGQDGRQLNRLAEAVSRCQAREHGYDGTPWSRYDEFDQAFFALEDATGWDAGYWVAYLIAQVVESYRIPDAEWNAPRPPRLAIYYLWTAHARRRQGYAKTLLNAVAQQIKLPDNAPMKFAWLTPLSQEGKAFALKMSQTTSHGELALI